jgi:hypothetical protein
MLPLNSVVQVTGIFEQKTIYEQDTDIYNMLPVIHVIDYELKTIMDFIPRSLAENIPDSIAQPRAEFLKSLKNLCGGDTLAADYLCALMFFQMYDFFDLVQTEYLERLPEIILSICIMKVLILGLCLSLCLILGHLPKRLTFLWII